MTGTNKSVRQQALKSGVLPLILSGIALATTLPPYSAFAAGTKPLPIERIGLDNARQLVVQFAAQPGAFPSIPSVLDLPGPNHRLVVDFADTTIDKAKIPTTDEMKNAMTKVLPAVNGIRYQLLANAAKPTARIVLELPEDLKVTARVVKVEETSVTINLGEAVRDLVVPKAAPAKNRQVSAKPAGESVLMASNGGESRYAGGAPVAGVPVAAAAAAAPQVVSASSAPVPAYSAPATQAAAYSAPVATQATAYSAPVATQTAAYSAPVATQATAYSAPVATESAAYSAPVATQAAARTVTTTRYDSAPNAAPSTSTQAPGSALVTADGETVALKPEQQVSETAPPMGTKSSTSATGWDWNTPVENELASKVAATQSLSSGNEVAAPAGASPVAGGSASAPAYPAKSAPAYSADSTPEVTSAALPTSVAPSPNDDPEQAFVKKIAAKELGLATPADQTNPIVQATPADQGSSVVQATPAIQATPVSDTTAAPESSPLSIADTAPVPVADEKPVAVAQADAPIRTERIETTPLQLPTDVAAPPKPRTAPTPAQAPIPADSDAAPSAPVAPAAAAPSAESGPAASLKLYNAAVKNHLSGKLMEAINDYKNALAANPSLAEAHSNLGLIYNQQHNYAGALGEFHKALAINPKDAITYNGIGAALRAEKDLAGAIKNWQTAVDIDPKLATAHYNLGTAYEIQKDYDKALESYRDAVTNDYRLGEAYYRMGLILQQKHRLEDAESQFKEALKVSANAEYSADAKQRLADLKTQKK